MVEKLLKQLENSYSPYSKFRVAAIVKTSSGEEYVGSNVENASYGATVCAERSAMFSAISNGVKKEDFEELHIMCDNVKIGSACFLCRQVISELFSEDKKIYMYNNKGDKLSLTVKELCPYPFKEEDLK